MRRLLASMFSLVLALAVGACVENPVSTRSPEGQASVEQAGELSASHGSGVISEASAVYRALGTEAAELNDFDRGERVGTLTVTDDGTNSLTVVGSAHGLEQEVVYVSLFYDKRSSVGGSPSSSNAALNAGACEPGLGSDHPQFLTVGQMEIGPGTSPGPLAWWDVASDGTATLGPTSTQEYVPIKKIGTVSIRDARVSGGFGAEAVVACGVVTHTPAR